MKMEKLDSKQMPQLIGLGVVSVVVFGWAAFSFLGGMAPAASQGTGKTADAAQAPDAKARVQVAQATIPGGAPGALGAPAVPGAPGQPGDSAVPSVPGMPGAGGQYNPDPFKSPYKSKDLVPAPVDKKPAGASKADTSPAPELPELGFQAPQWTPAPAAAAPAPAAPAPPARPDVLVTGVIAGEGVRDMATMKVGSEEKILQVGDRVNDATTYKVRKIAPDGVVLAQGKDSFFVALGAKTPGAKVDTK